jgi:hypothetical protein
MLPNKALSCLIVLSALVPPACAVGIAPTPAPSFTISASNVTMPLSGTVAIPFTLTSVNGFAGQVSVFCVQPTVPGSVNKGPYCDQGGPLMAYTLVANGTTTGSITIVAIQPNPVPLTSKLKSAGRREGAGLALAGMVMLGLRRRRPGSRRLMRASLAFGIMMALAGIGLCGCGGPPTLTPGAYLFMLNATSVSTPILAANTTATVTVPAGIVTKSNN